MINLFANLKKLTANSIYSLWLGIAFPLVMLALVLLIFNIPADYYGGEAARSANQSLHKLNHSLVAFKADVLSDPYEEGSELSIEKEFIKLDVMISDYDKKISFDNEHARYVSIFKDSYNRWAQSVKQYVNYYLQSNRNQSMADENALDKLEENNNILFIDALRSLTEIGIILQSDIHSGQRAAKIIQWSSLVFIIYLFVIVFIHERLQKRKHANREANLDITLRSIGEAVIATDINGCVTCMNPKAEYLTGWEFQNAKGHALSEVFKVVNRESGEPQQDLVEQVVDEDSIVILAEESMLIASNGKRYQIYENGAPIHDNAGNIIGVVLVFRDITESYQLSQKLNDSAGRLQRVVDTSMDAVIVSDEQGVIQEWNPAAESMFGWSGDEARSCLLHELIIPEEYVKQHLAGIEHLIKNKSTPIVAKRIETEALHKDGHIIPIELAMTSIHTQNGWVFNAFIRDLTDKLNNERIIQKNNVLLNEAQQLAKLGCWELNHVTGDLWFSDHVFEQFGCDPETTKPSLEYFFNNLHPDDRERVDAEFKESIENRTQYNTAFRFITPDGIKTFNAQCKTSYDENNRPLRSLGLNHDISEKISKEQSLVKTNVLLNEAQSLAEMGCWELDYVTGNLWWSDEVFDLFGCDPATTTSDYETFLSCLHPDDRERVNAEFTGAVENHTLYNTTFRVLTPDGTKIFGAQCETSYDENNQPIRSLGLVQDITEHKRVEDQFRKQNAILKEAQHVAKLGYWELDLVSDTLEWSDEVFRIFCIDPENNIPSVELFMSSVHPDDRERVDNAFNNAVDNKLDYNIVHRIVTDQGIKVLHERCQTEYDDSDHPVRSLGLVQDITERVNILDELRLAEVTFSTHAGILITNNEGIIIRVNPAFEAMTGYSAGELIGKNPNILNSKKQDSEYYKKMWKSLATEGIWQGELLNRRKDGKLYAEWLTITAVKDENGEVTHYVGTALNISDRTEHILN